MLAVDTSVLVLLLARDDAKQAEAADRFVAKGAWVSHLVLAETLSVLEAVYNRSAVQIIAALKLLLTHESLVLQDAETVNLALGQFWRKSAPGFSVCPILENARRAGHLRLGTFDKALIRLKGTQEIQSVLAAGKAGRSCTHTLAGLPTTDQPAFRLVLSFSYSQAVPQRSQR